jgi:hypothetical protein
MEAAQQHFPSLLKRVVMWVAEFLLCLQWEKSTEHLEWTVKAKSLPGRLCCICVQTWCPKCSIILQEHRGGLPLRYLRIWVLLWLRDDCSIDPIVTDGRIVTLSSSCGSLQNLRLLSLPWFWLSSTSPAQGFSPLSAWKNSIRKECRFEELVFAPSYLLIARGHVMTISVPSTAGFIICICKRKVVRNYIPWCWDAFYSV